MFVCFIDFSKAFDKVNYWKLFRQLLDGGVNTSIVSLLAYWYTYQQACVLWIHVQSSSFFIGNGTKQGGILSPYLFTRSCCLLYHLVGLVVLLLIFLLMLITLAFWPPAWAALQNLILLISRCCQDLGLTFNVKNLSV